MPKVEPTIYGDLANIYERLSKTDPNQIDSAVRSWKKFVVLTASSDDSEVTEIKLKLERRSR